MNGITVGDYVRIGGSDLTWKVLEFQANGNIAVLESGLTGRRRRELVSSLKLHR